MGDRLFLNQDEIVNLITCPACAAPAKTMCMEPSGKFRKKVHKPRIKAARDKLGTENALPQRHR